MEAPVQRLKLTLINYMPDRIHQMRMRGELRRWKRSGDADELPNLLKQHTVRDYGRRFGLRMLVETGTFLGSMIQATQADFDRIVSIELDPWLSARAQRKFRSAGHISVLQGDSASRLASVLAVVSQPCLFWLDAHYSGGITARGPVDTPIVDELGQILRHPLAGHVVLVDDARCFNGEMGYPAMADLEALVRTTRPEMEFHSNRGIIRIHPRTR